MNRIKAEIRISNKSFYRILFLGILFVLLLGSMPVWAGDFREDETVTITEVIHENPLYGGAGTQYRTTTVSENEYWEEASVGYAAESVSYYSSIDAAAKYFRSCMRNRNTSINLAISTSKQSVVSDIAAVYQKALNYEMDGKSTDGDYLRFSYGYIYCKDTNIPDDKAAERWTLHYTVYYYTSAEQEEELGGLIKKELSNLQLAGLSEREKAQEIYRFVCDHVVYDHGSYPSYTGEQVRTGKVSLKSYMASKGLFTAYQAMKSGKAVCQGYATLLYRMLMESGITNRIILGNAGGVAHAWNLVRIGNLYYNVDATWDAGKTNFAYFLKAENEFPNHIRNNTLGSNRMDYTSLEFQRDFPTAGLTALPAEEIRFEDPQEYYFYTGKAITPAVVVPGLTKDVDYSILYENNIEPGTLSVKIKGMGYCLGTVTLTARIVKNLPTAQIALKQKKTVYEYTGKAIKPEVVVPGCTLGKDYKITYSSNIKPGILTISIEAMGDYVGSKTLKCRIFEIPEIKKVETVKQTAATGTTVKVNWSKAAGATGYQVFYYHPTQKKNVEYTRVSGTSCTLKGSLLKPGTSLKIIIRPFYQKKITYEGVSSTFTKTGPQSKRIQISTQPKTPTLKLKKSSGKITATWSRQTTGKGYQIQISTDPSFASAKTSSTIINGNGTVSKAYTSVKGQKLKKKTEYYVRVRAWCKAVTTEKEIYVPGAWSKAASITWS